MKVSILRSSLLQAVSLAQISASDTACNRLLRKIETFIEHVPY